MKTERLTQNYNFWVIKIENVIGGIGVFYEVITTRQQKANKDCHFR